MDLSKTDTPALIIDIDRVSYNISIALEMAGGPDRLRPHVKTHKLLEVARMQCEAGIYKFKCATVPEAEMLGMARAADVLIAYQPQGPKVDRVLQLQSLYPDTKYSVLIDNAATAAIINDKCAVANTHLDVWIDVNDGHNRSGIKPADVEQLVADCKKLSNLYIAGLHCYDGHVRISNLEERTAQCKSDFEAVLSLRDRLAVQLERAVTIVAGGSPTFSVHAVHHDVECSPGTWIFWDQRYESDYPEQPFAKAATLATRVISKIDAYTYCLDLGHKSVASEMSLPRVHFEGYDDLIQTGHSEEHMVVASETPDLLHVGQILMVYPYHICPTVALYDHVQVASDDEIISQWKVIARDRSITV